MEHPVLERSASGLRHLRWAREVLGTLSGYLLFDEHLSDAQRSALDAELARVTALVAALSGAVKPYRDFLERTRTLARGKVRACAGVAAGDAGLASPPAPEQVSAIGAAAAAALGGEIETTRRRLREDLSRAIDATRDGLRAMDAHLERTFSPAFVHSLYPALAPGGTRVQDDGDPDDDAAG